MAFLFVYQPMWTRASSISMLFTITVSFHLFLRSVDAISGEWNFKTLTMITFAFVNDKLEVMPLESDGGRFESS